MNNFLNDNFLLSNDLAIKLYNSVKDLPIIDFHSHISPKEIYENNNYDCLGSVWLECDHYKWRIMRQCGIDDNGVNGSSSFLEKFKNYAKSIQNAIGNPVLHWSHLELKRFFNIDDFLKESNADMIYKKTLMALKEDNLKPRAILKKMNVESFCTTDDPLDELNYHKLFNKEESIKMLPTFRPDRFLNINLEIFNDLVNGLERITKKINNVDDYVSSLNNRIDYFISNGCYITDHGLDVFDFIVPNKEIVNSAFNKKRLNKVINGEEALHFKSYILFELAKKYAQSNLVMQLHIGALRNISTKKFNEYGSDCGCDAMSDELFIVNLKNFLDELHKIDLLPKTIIYTINTLQNNAIACLLPAYAQANINSKVQLGSAWWFCDSIEGMTSQMKSLSSNGVFGNFVGMVTDSRSLLSYVRIEYFRRILCNFISEQVVNGLYPNDFEILENMVSNICYKNIKKYCNLGE